MALRDHRKALMDLVVESPVQVCLRGLGQIAAATNGRLCSEKSVMMPAGQRLKLSAQCDAASHDNVRKRKCVPVLL